MHRIFHVSLLQLYLLGRTQKGPPDPIVTRENQKYEVKRILPHKKTIDWFTKLYGKDMMP